MYICRIYSALLASRRISPDRKLRAIKTTRMSDAYSTHHLSNCITTSRNLYIEKTVYEANISTEKYSIYASFETFFHADFLLLFYTRNDTK